MKADGSVPVKSICEGTGISDYSCRKALSELVKNGLLEILGNGPTTKYTVATSSPEMLTKLQIMVEVFKRDIIRD